MSDQTASNNISSNQAALLQRILEISRRMAETRELNPLLEYVMEQALAFTDGEHGYLVLVSEDKQLDFRVTYGEPYEGEDNLTPVSHSIIEKVIDDGEPLLVRDAFGDSPYQNMVSVMRLRLRSVLCVPLSAQGEMLGVLYIENRKRADAFDEGDIPRVMIFASQAATAIKNAQLNEMQKELTSQLEAKVKERTAELQQSQEQAEAGWAAALEENRLRTALLANVAHDLRSPLNVVINALEYMRIGGFGDVTEEQDEWIGRSLAATQQVLRLVNDIFDLSKIEQGNLELYQEALEVQPLLEQTLAIAEGLKRNDNVRLEMDIAADIPYIWADRDRLQQILVNLFSNAFKFTEQGAVTVESKLDPLGQVLFKVTDTGSGIPEEDLPKVFDRFHQSKANPTLRKRGTGLGLAICKELVERHGGEIWVESEVGIGTTFYFTLPVANSNGHSN